MLLALASCGGGGGGGPPPAPPVILASLIGFPSNGAPPGAMPPGSNGNTMASVLVVDGSSGAPVSDAAVTLNGVGLAYVPAVQDYEGALSIDPGAAVSLSVTVGAASYTVAATQFSAYPTITAPARDATWYSQEPNLVAWSAVAPSSNSVYALGVLDANGQAVWPPDAILALPPTTTSYTIGAGALSAGSRLVLVGVATALPIPNADASSAIVIGGFNYVPITVTSTPAASLVSIAVSPTTPALGIGKTLQLTATGTYSDNSTQDLTAQVTWASSASGVVTVSATGLATGVDFGSATISATLGTVAGSATVTVFQPTPSPAPPLSRSVTYQIDYAHSGRAVFGTPLAFPSSASWSVTLPGAVSYPLIADGKVYVTAVTPATPSSIYGTDLYALDAQTGSIVWGPVPISGTYFWSGHAYDHGKIFVVNFDGLLRSFDAATGQAGWSTLLPGQNFFTSPPTAVNGVVYVGGPSAVYAVNEANGAVLWTAGVNGGSNSAPAVSADGVFVSYPCQVYKFDPLSGATLWHYNGPCSGGGGRTAAYADDRLYVRDWTDPVSRVFDATTGTQVGTFNATPIPALAAQTGYFLQAGTLRGIDLASHQVLWSFAGDGQLVSAPIVIDQVVIVGSGSGAVYALNASSGALIWTGAAGAPISAPDEQNVIQPLTGFGAGEGLLVVPASNVLTAWRISGP
jgi:outer membrane protein assembly factor BamB